MNQLITLNSCWSSHNVGSSNRPSFNWNHEGWPLLFFLSKFHLYQLDLPATILALDVQVKTNKCESQLDRFDIFICRLCCKCIDNMLVNE